MSEKPESSFCPCRVFYLFCDIIRPRGTPTEINNKIPDVSHTYFLYTCNFIESVKCLIYRGYRILTALFQFNDDFYRNLDQV